MQLRSFLQQCVQKAAEAAFPDTVLPAPEIAESQFAHYQVNSAMRWGKLLQLPPRVVAEKVIAELKTLSAEVAGPGFINLWLPTEMLEKDLLSQARDPRLGLPATTPLKTIVDFSGPNTAKEMHVGHLRSTIIGDCIARVLTFVGHNVLRLNHIGDYGTAFGMLIAYLKQYNEEPKALTQLMLCYKAAKLLFDSDENFKKASQAEVVKLQNGERESLACWEKICDISRRAYQEIYDTLGIDITERGESFYGPFLADVVRELETKQLLELSDGAKCLFLEDFSIPLIVQKRDGGYNYDTTDLAAIRHRILDEKADWIIYVTDAGQGSHFAMIFAAAKKAGWLTHTRVDHVPFGLVLGLDGKKFRTRSGDTEKLIDLIATSIQKAEAVLLEKGSDVTIAPILGINAIKYADLCCARTGDYQFNADRMVQFEGNTAAFLMYSYVRAKSILKRIGEALTGPFVLGEESEERLGLHLLKFPDVIDTFTQDLLPHRLADYLFRLSELFNAFFRDCRVEGSEQQQPRALLCLHTATILKKGMELLGLKTVERM